MATLLLRFAAPMQSWGNDESKFDIRKTHTEPTKSGVIGMLAAALGIGRTEDERIQELASGLRIGIRVDQEGKMITDFHTARGFKRTSAGDVRYEKGTGLPMKEDSPYVTRRSYLCDAIFLVGLECESMEKLETYAQALKNPVYSLFLGRRSCPPTLPLVLGTTALSLEQALQQEKWLVTDQKQGGYHAHKFLRLVMEAKPGEAFVPQRDQPVSFSPVRRQFAFRRVAMEKYIPPIGSQHDPMKDLSQEVD